MEAVTILLGTGRGTIRRMVEGRARCADLQAGKGLAMFAPPPPFGRSPSPCRRGYSR